MRLIILCVLSILRTLRLNNRFRLSPTHEFYAIQAQTNSPCISGVEKDTFFKNNLTGSFTISPQFKIIYSLKRSPKI